MDPSVIIGIVSSVIAVISIAVTSYVIYLDSREFTAVSKGRKKAITGTWKGPIQHLEKINGLTPTGKIELQLQARRKKVSGIMLIDHAMGDIRRHDRIIIHGGFKMDRFLEMNFHNDRDEVVQFGNMILELDPMGEKLEGKLHGYGPVSKRVMSGHVSLEKEQRQA